MTDPNTSTMHPIQTQATAECAYGWLDPSGRYHHVKYCGHASYIRNETRLEDSCEAEHLGWIHVSDGNYAHCGRGLHSRITQDQRRWLNRAGFTLHEGDEE